MRARRLAAALAAVGLVAGLTACSTGRSSSDSSAEASLPTSTYTASATVPAGKATELSLGDGATVTLSAGAAPAGTTLTTDSKNPPGAWSADQIVMRAPVHLMLSSGEPKGGATLSFPYDPSQVPKGVSPADEFGVSTYDETIEQWVPVSSTVDTTHHLIIAKVPHFSWYAPWTWDWEKIGARVSQDVLSLLGKRTSPPKCSSGSLPSYIQNVVTKTDTSDPLYSCAENASGTLRVKLVDNRTYGVVLSEAVKVKNAKHDSSGDVTQSIISGFIDPTIPSGELFIPSLASASMEIPDGSFTTATFKAAPTTATLLGDVFYLALGNIPLPAMKGYFVDKMKTECAAMLKDVSLPTSTSVILSDVVKAGGCIEAGVNALANSGALDKLKGSQLTNITGSLKLLQKLSLYSKGVDLGAQLGDWILGATVDKGLRQFSVYHEAKAPTTTRQAPPPVQHTTTAPPVNTGTPSYNVGDHFSDNCSYAAPFQPSYQNDGVVWTLQCADVIRDLPFWVVQVFFSDPKMTFPENGQTYGVRVNGTIIAKTQGFPSTLVVNAS